jgi:S-adenosylmethionine-dependent methyltransferase
MKMTAKASREWFERDASKYAAYLETPEGRLRTDLTFANLQEFLPSSQAINSLCALDLGCGTGAAGIRLARLGVRVTLLDSWPAMLEIAKDAAHDANSRSLVTTRHGDASELSSLFNAGSFDIILCHNVLEYVDDPGSLLRGIARVMRNPSAILSLLVRNRAGEVLKAALQGDLAAATHNLATEWGQESLYGGKVRLFTWEALEGILKDASLTLTARRGVRVVADYLPPQISRSEEYERIFALERELGKRQEFFGVARYMHILARHVASGAEVDE